MPSPEPKDKKTKRKKRKRDEFENQEEVESAGFYIEGDSPPEFLEHLNSYTTQLFQSTQEVLDENLPIIHNSLATVKSFITLLGKIL